MVMHTFYADNDINRVNPTITSDRVEELMSDVLEALLEMHEF